MNQSQTEACPILSVTIEEKSETPPNKEKETEATSFGTTSVTAEQRSEVVKTSNNLRQEKRREKKSGDGDKDSQIAISSNRSSSRSKRQTQFFGSPLKHSVKNVEEKSDEENFQTIPISPGDIPSSSGNTPSPSPRRKLRRPMLSVLNPAQVQGKKTL